MTPRAKRHQRKPTPSPWERTRLDLLRLPLAALELCRRRKCFICESYRLCEHREPAVLIAELQALRDAGRRDLGRRAA